MQYFYHTKVTQVKRFIENFKIDQLTDSNVKLLCENQVVIATIKSGEVGSRGKNIELQYHYILDMIQKEELHVNYIPKKGIFTNFLTKPINIKNFRKHV